MPYKSQLNGIKKQFIDKDVYPIIYSAIEGIKSVATNDNLLLVHKKELISVLIWKITEANGKWSTRYRSEGVLDDSECKIQHEHVYTRKFLTEQILQNPSNAEHIVQNAIGCLVTEQEHSKLTAITSSQKLQGWDRYEAAQITIYDMLTGNAFIGQGQPIQFIQTKPRNQKPLDIQNVTPQTNEYSKLWKEVIAILMSQYPDINTGTLSNRSYHKLPIGFSGLHVAMAVHAQGQPAVVSFVTETESKDTFDMLFKNRNLIEEELEEHLIWERLDTKKRTLISAHSQLHFEDPGERKELIAWFTDTSYRFIQVFTKYLG
jgi:hypothetical protein